MVSLLAAFLRVLIRLAKCDPRLQKPIEPPAGILCVSKHCGWMHTTCPPVWHHPNWCQSYNLNQVDHEAGWGVDNLRRHPRWFIQEMSSCGRPFWGTGCFAHVMNIIFSSKQRENHCKYTSAPKPSEPTFWHLPAGVAKNLDVMLQFWPVANTIKIPNCNTQVPVATIQRGIVQCESGSVSFCRVMSFPETGYGFPVLAKLIGISMVHIM